jgi:hypothetical protein
VQGVVLARFAAYVKTDFGIEVVTLHKDLSAHRDLPFVASILPLVGWRGCKLAGCDLSHGNAFDRKK